MCASPISASMIGKEGVGGCSSVPALVGDSEGGSHYGPANSASRSGARPNKTRLQEKKKVAGSKWAGDELMDGYKKMRKTDMEALKPRGALNVLHYQLH